MPGIFGRIETAFWISYEGLDTPHDASVAGLLDRQNKEISWINPHHPPT